MTGDISTPHSIHSWSCDKEAKGGGYQGAPGGSNPTVVPTPEHLRPALGSRG